ncbi:right-handed parallel beta-helix repeat-containing protein [Desulfovibrio mangrovi]|uniref:right-handed parallel beta-helix repeat-containing protein n=1 Tax=Desulfovibrio mangrovi TaxID=2976983 RepID=UPI002247DCCC|nr:right-handed parallel beta-helix repeat-containing protein [Desulfovibrio mangrovi]UZP67616.1 right-handed parallel beta-helix repeat-containing protein [Desulfovibrio mangrovi]
MIYMTSAYSPLMLLVVLLVVALPHDVSARTFFFSKEGVGNGNGSRVRPYNKLEYIKKIKLVAGDKVVICGIGFKEQVLELRGSGMPDMPIVVTGEGDRKPQVKGVYYRSFMGAGGWDISDLKIVNDAGNGVDVEKISGLSLKNIQIERSAGHGIYIHGSMSIKIDQVVVRDSGRNGMLITASDDVVVSNSYVENSGIKIGSHNVDGIAIQGGDSVYVIDTISANNETTLSSGFDTAGESDKQSVFIRCVSYGNAENGFSFKGGEGFNSLISGCLSVDNKNGVEVGNGQNVIVTDNILYDNYNCGVKLNSGGNTVLFSNFIWNNSRPSTFVGAQLAIDHRVEDISFLTSNCNIVGSEYDSHIYYHSKHGSYSLREWQKVSGKDRYSSDLKPALNEKYSSVDFRRYDMESKVCQDELDILNFTSGDEYNLLSWKVKDYKTIFIKQ